MRFSAKIELSEEEKIADEKLRNLRAEVASTKYNPALHAFYENMVSTFSRLGIHSKISIVLGLENHAERRNSSFAFERSLSSRFSHRANI